MLDTSRKPLITVWLTSYNHARFLQETIDSILAQTFQDFELVIVDDYSTDDSWSIIERYEAASEKVIGIRHSKNLYDLNCSVPLHREHLRGDYLAIAHSDDTWAPDKLEKQMQLLETHSDISACFTWVAPIDDESDLITDEKNYYRRVFSVTNRSRSEWLHYFFFEGNPLCHPSMVIRTEVLEKDGLIIEAPLHSIPDFCRWIRLCTQAEIAVIEEPLTLFRVHEDASNTSGDNLGNRFRTATEDYLVLKEFERIDSISNLLETFPEAARFCNDEQTPVPYVLARIALEYGSWRMHKLYGLETLYDLLCDTTNRKTLEDNGYTFRDYNLDKQRFDVFGSIEPYNYLDCGLYIDFGEGFNERDSIRQTIYAPSLTVCKTTWNLEEICRGRQPVALRFDPDETYFREYHVSATAAEEKLEMVACNASSSDEGWSCFFTTDPQYLIKNTTNIRCLSVSITSRFIRREICETYSHELEDTRKQLLQLENSGSWRFTKPFRTVKRKLQRSRQSKKR